MMRWRSPWPIVIVLPWIICLNSRRSSESFGIAPTGYYTVQTVMMYHEVLPSYCNKIFGLIKTSSWLNLSFWNDTKASMESSENLKYTPWFSIFSSSIQEMKICNADRECITISSFLQILQVFPRGIVNDIGIYILYFYK